MHECFVFGSEHEELAKAFALKLFGDGETLSSEVPPEMMKLIKRQSKTVNLASKSLDKFCKEWREIVSAPVLSGAESTKSIPPEPQTVLAELPPALRESGALAWRRRRGRD